MAVACNADGRMEVFARGTDRALIHIWQVGPNAGWANQWMSLGGRLRSVPAVGRNADGRLEVFAVLDDDSIGHISQTAPNNGWSAWEDFGAGELLPLVAPVVARNADGRLEVFCIMVPPKVNEGMLFHRQQEAGGPGWSSWESLGRPPGDAPDAQLARLGWDSTFPQFDVGRNADGRLEAFALTHSGALWHIRQNEPNGVGLWSAWFSFEPPPGNVVFDKSPVVALNSSGQLELFGRGPDGRVWHKGQGGPIDGWSGWNSLEGALTSAPAVSRNADGRLELFGRGPQGLIWHKWQGGPKSAWSNWEVLSFLPVTTALLGLSPDTDGFPSVGQNADGRLQVFAHRRLPSSLGWMTWQGGPYAGWAGWEELATWSVNTSGAFGRGLIEP